jgi:hypothetical protein
MKTEKIRENLIPEGQDIHAMGKEFETNRVILDVEILI